MNPLMQLNRRLHCLFIAVLLACFAITQSARAGTPQPDGGDANGGTIEENNALLPELSTGMGRLTPQQVGPNKWVIHINFTDSVCDKQVTVQANLVVVGGQPIRIEGFKASAPNFTFPEHKFQVESGKNENGEIKFRNITIKVYGPGRAPSRVHFEISLGHIKYRFMDGKATNLQLGRLDVFCL